MNVQVRNLSVLSYAQGFSLWHYKLGERNVGDIWQPGYFSTSVDMFEIGDMILVSGSSGSTIVMVSSKTDGVVVEKLT
ncbi:hypothetical protein UFOVP1619_11 [uncultured Caudovirales phage]|uniref:Uncharacterized protein n=1 Tax=uncultured Caudovirales phage TaxID=2100421 RepID=A0A6J5SW12_9CAUD|nr:hypothetical protein UFOVP1619_11 [uncultured Caudovirales phage]